MYLQWSALSELPEERTRQNLFELFENRQNWKSIWVWSSVILSVFSYAVTHIEPTRFEELSPAHIIEFLFVCFATYKSTIGIGTAIRKKNPYSEKVYI